MVDTVTFNGIKFRRYPESENRTARVYYTPGIADKMRGVGRLHEEVWRDRNGPIQSGCVIHHADGNPLNNEPDNLVCLTASDHSALHFRENGPWVGFKENLDRIRPLAAAWHGSEAGLAWHREHAKACGFGRASYGARKCKHCGREYEARNAAARFCSNACKSAWRRAAGLDNVQRTCERCGAAFTTGKYDGVRFCSSACWPRRGPARS